MKIKGILLDIDNTLYDYENIHNIALNAACDTLQKKYSISKTALIASYKKARLYTHKKLSGTASSHNRLLYFQKMLEDLKLHTLKDALEAYDIYWGTFLENLTAHDGVYDFLGLVNIKKICLISDLTADIQHRKIRKLRLYDYTDFLVTSEEAGKEKPHPRIFKLALKKIGLGTSHVCMIGDSYKNDMAGAVKLGIRSFWINKKGESKPSSRLITEVKNFRELIRFFK